MSVLSAGDMVNNRYRVISLLGKGGLSYVYDVEDTLLPKRWALKEFYPKNLEPADLASVREQFGREVRILSSLHHPRLPAITDSFTFNERDYMVMELIEGKTLDQMLTARSEPFSEEEVRLWALQILEILEYLHSQNPPVIYRDLKPHNIIISPETGLRFIDFGIARLFNPVKEQDTIFMGTPGYAPPEQFRQRQTDVRSDIYSLGATLHYLLTLRDPGTNPFDFEPVSLINRNVSPLFEKVIQKALEIKAENRFQSASEMRKVLSGEISFEEVSGSSFIIVEPREVTLVDCAPGRSHEREVVVKSSSAGRVKGNVTSSHAGLEVSPSQLDASSVTVKIRTIPKHFPRGEKVVTDLVVSTEGSKISVPVTVHYKPTLLRGLSPAFVSMLFFVCPVAVELIWMGNFLSPRGDLSVAGMALPLLSFVAMGMVIPSKYMKKMSLLMYAGILALLLFLGHRLAWISSAQNAFYSHMLPAFVYFFSWALLVNVALFFLAMRLSPSQRADIRIVIVASFFVFPALLYIIPLFALVSRSFIFANSFIFFCISAGLSLFFAVLFFYCAYREQAELAQQQESKVKYARLFHLLGTVGVSLVFGAVWYMLCFGSANLWLSRALPAKVPGARELLSMSIYLPLGCKAYWGAESAWYCLGMVVLLACIFYFFFPACKLPIRIMMVLLLGGVFLNLCRIVDDVRMTSLEKIRVLIAKSPVSLIMEMRSTGASFGRDFEKFYESLDVGRKRAESRDYGAFRTKLEYARRILGADSSIDSAKLLFMIDQAKICDIREAGEHVTWSYLDGAEGSEKLSSSSLSYFKSRFDDQVSDIGRMLVVPDSTFFLIAGGKCYEYKNDYEVMASLRFYEGFLKESRGDLDGARKSFLKMKLRLDSMPESEIGALLKKEFQVRSGLNRQFPDLDRQAKYYYQELASYYRKTGNYNFAIHLTVYSLEHFSTSILEKAGLIDLLYAGGARERADRLVESLIKSLSAGAEAGDVPAAGYLQALQKYAHGSYYDACRILDSLKSDAQIGRDPLFLRKYRDCAVFLRMWDKVAALSPALMKTSAWGTSDYLKWAWSLDITGHFEKAKPCYESFVRESGGAKNTGALVATVKNRIAGGPIPTYVIVEQNSGIIPLHRIVIFGEGIPPEHIPKITIYYGDKTEPSITVSDNIVLVDRYVRRALKNFNWLYYKVKFKDLAQENRTRQYRFYCCYDFQSSYYYPIEFEQLQPTLLNRWFVKGVPDLYSLPDAEKNWGVTLLHSAGHSLVAMPLFSFDASGKEYQAGLARIVFKYYNTTYSKPFREIDPEDLFGLFSREETR